MANDLYTDGYIIRYPDNTQSLERDPEIIINPNRVITYIIKDGDTLQLLAFKHYGDSSQWYVIAEANGIYNPLEEVVTGKEILIPNGKN